MPLLAALNSTVQVVETVPAGVVVSAIEVSANATLLSSNGAVANVKVGPGLNIVYYEDEIPPPQNGHLSAVTFGASVVSAPQVEQRTVTCSVMSSSRQQSRKAWL